MTLDLVIMLCAEVSNVLLFKKNTSDLNFFFLVTCYCNYINVLQVFL